MRKNILDKIRVVATVTIVMLITSCTQFLDVKPVGKLIPTKAEELEKLLNNRTTIDYHFLENNAGSYYALLGDNFRISENQADHLFVNTNPNVNRLAAYIYYLPYDNPNLPGRTWELGIFRATGIFNIVIDGINNIPGGPESEIGKTALAQAKAGRAWSMLVGTVGFGPMYDPNGSNDTRVLPYRTAAEPTAPNPDLSTTAELFSLIEADLKEALEAPVQVANPTRASQAAVHALLAQLYMYKRDWPNMLNSAEAAWSASLAAKGGVDNLIYDLNQFSYRSDPNASPAPGTDVEVSLELQGPDLLFNQSNNRENLLYRISPPGTAHYPSEEFLGLFDQDSDLRYQLFALKALGYSTTVGGVKHDDGIVTNYYRDAKMLGNQGITHPEVLLMKAEASARLSDLGSALADLNLLRKYRYEGPETDLPGGSTLSQDALLHEILKERRRELPIGTFQRTFDIRRYALDTGKPWSQTQITHYIGSKAYTAQVDNAYFTMKISNNVIEQNPQWGLTPWSTVYDPAANR